MFLCEYMVQMWLLLLNIHKHFLQANNLLRFQYLLKILQNANERTIENGFILSVEKNSMKWEPKFS
jgi:hypothetical protein